MALPSSKSSSGNSPALANPITARPQNPNPRSSETTNPMRRSFSGNPFTKPSIIANPRGFSPATPANSPEFPRRRDSVPCLREHEEKENGNDPSSNTRQARVRSPSIYKGSKHFMSPTISAASKFNPSPRKKILSERSNDQIHSSITSISDLRSSCGSVNISGSTEEPDAKMTVEASQDSTVIDSEAGPDASSHGSKGSRKKVAFDSVNHEIPPVESTHAGTEDDLVNVDEEFVNPKLPSSPLVAPLDADPLVPLPPYDPKTNYLSPRPQFLHYRPNPRIKGFLGDEGNFTFDTLEDGFDLEGLTDTDMSTEETSQSEKESDDASSNGSTKEEARPEPKPDGLEISEEETLEAKEAVEKEKAVETMEAVGAEELPKRSFFTRSMFIASIFIALVAGSAMIGTHYSPTGSHLKIQRPSFPVEAEQLSDNIVAYTRIWYANSLSYLSALVSEFRGREYEWGELQFYNLTDLGENPWLVKNDIIESLRSDDFENLEVGTEEEEEEIEYSESEEEAVAEVPGDEPEEQEDDETVHNESGQEGEILDAEIEEVKIDAEVKVEMSFAAENHEAPLAAETESDQPELPLFEVENESEIPNVESTNQPELPMVEDENKVYDQEEEGSIELEADYKTASESSETVDSSQITGLVGVLVALLAAVACLAYAKKRTTPGDVVPPVKGIQTRESLVAKKFDISPVAANHRATEFDVVGVESCPSEMSSFQNYPTSSTHSKKGLRLDLEITTRSGAVRGRLSGESPQLLPSQISHWAPLPPLEASPLMR